jgi:hypothetical protein
VVVDLNMMIGDLLLRPDIFVRNTLLESSKLELTMKSCNSV